MFSLTSFKFSAAISLLGLDLAPSGITAGPDGNVWVADTLDSEDIAVSV